MSEITVKNHDPGWMGGIVVCSSLIDNDHGHGSTLGCYFIITTFLSLSNDLSCWYDIYSVFAQKDKHFMFFLVSISEPQVDIKVLGTKPNKIVRQIHETNLSLLLCFISELLSRKKKQQM